MIDDYVDKLNQLMGRMTTEQVRQVLRFAQFIYEDQEPEGMHTTEDPAVRYQEFAKWCQSSGIDLGTVTHWGVDANGKTIQTATREEL
jgi:predicted RNA-binding protein (virulence factor B family)